jgi:hypothetical protein
MYLMRADTSDVAFRLLLALGELWDGLQRAHIDPSTRGLYVTKEFLGGYTRYSAGPSSTARLVVEWNESSRHLRVLRCSEWPGFEKLISTTITYVRDQARTAGISDIVEQSLVGACSDPMPSRRTVLSNAMEPVAVGARRA